MKEQPMEEASQIAADVDAAALVAKFERAVLDATHLHRAYQEARLVAGTNEALTGLFNAMEDAQAKRERHRRALLAVLADKTCLAQTWGAA